MPANGAFDAVAYCGAIVIVGEPATLPLLRRLNAIDVPGTRSSHSFPTPRGGGIPIAAGLLVAVILVRGGASTAFAAAVGFFGMLGLVDDLHGLSAVRRLALQGTGSAAVAALLVLPMHLAVAATAALVVATAVWITGFVNVFNFMDGVNGISATHALIAGLAYACYGEWTQQQFLLAASLAVAVGALVFLPWNAGRARVFLGDVGSYTLGAALAVLAADAVQHGVPVEAALGPLALYLTDTAWTLQRRIRAGERWLQSHRTHVYQRWCDAGWSHQEVTLATGAITILLTTLGTVSLTGNFALRTVADLTGMAILAAYLRSPVLFRRLSLCGEAEPHRPPGRPGNTGPQWDSKVPGRPG